MLIQRIKFWKSHNLYFVEKYALSGHIEVYILFRPVINVIKSPFYYWCFEIFQVKIIFQTINHWLHIKLSILSSMTLFDKNMLKFYLLMIKGREVSRGRVTHIIRRNNTKMAGDNAERSKTDSPACLEFITWNKDPTIFW